MKTFFVVSFSFPSVYTEDHKYQVTKKFRTQVAASDFIDSLRQISNVDIDVVTRQEDY